MVEQDARNVSGAHRLMQAVSTLHTISLDISAQTDVPAVLQRIIQCAIDLLDREMGGTIWLFDPARGVLVLTGGVGDRMAEFIGATLNPGEGLGGKVFASRETITVDDYPTWSGSASQYTNAAPHAVMGIPLLWQGDVIGVMTFAANESGPIFSRDDVQLCELFAAQAAIAIGNLRMFESTQRRIEQLDSLRIIAVELLAATDVKHILRLIARAALEHTSGQDVHLYLYDQSAGELTFGTSLWSDGTVDQEYSAPRPDGITMTVARTGKRMLVVDPRHDPMFAGAGGGEALAAFVSVPFRRGDEVLGVFNIAFDKQTIMDRGLLNFLDLLAAQAAVAIYNAQLFNHAQRRAEESDRLRKVAVEILSSTDITTILHRIGQEAVEHCRAQDVRIYLYDQANDRLTFGTSLRDGETETYPPRPHGLTATVARTGERILVSDPANHPLFAEASRQQSWTFNSVVGVPLKRGSEVIGVFNSIFEERITEDTLRFLDLLAAQAAVAIQNARLFAATENRAEEYRRLRAAALELLSSTDTTSMMRGIARAAVEGANADFVYLYKYDQDTDTLEFGVGYDGAASDTVSHAAPRPDGMTATVARSGERLTVINPSTHPMFGELEGTAVWQALNTIVSVPFKEGSRVLGVMNVFFQHRVGEEVHTFLDLLAAQGVVGFQNAQLYEAERAARTRANVVLNAALTLSSTLSVGDLLRAILDECAKVLPMISGSILIYDEDERAPSIVALKGFEGREGQIVELLHDALKDDKLFATMRETRQPMIIPDISVDPLWTHIEEVNHIKSWLGVPLITHGEMIGVLALDGDHLNAFAAEHVEMAQGLASHAAIAIDNARLLNGTQEALAQLEAFFHASQSLITAKGPEDLLRAVAAPALATGRCNAALLYVDLDDQGKIEWAEIIAATQEADGPTMPAPGTHIRVSDLPIGRLIRRNPGRVLTFPHVDSSRTHNALTLNLLKGLGSHSVAFIPLMLGERLVGLITLQWSQEHEFSPREIQFYRVLSPQLAAVVENRRLFEQTRQAQERFRDIALSTSDWVWETNARGRVIFCTERILDSLGYSPQEYIGHTFYEFMQADEGNRVRHIINSHAAVRRPIQGMVYWAIHRNGQRVELSTSAVPIIDDRRGVIGFRGVTKDITEQRRTEQRERLAYEIGQRMTGVLSLEEVASATVEQLHQVFGYFPATLFLYDEEKQALVVRKEATSIHGELSLSLDLQPSLIALAARRREVVVSNNVLEDPNYLLIDRVHETRSEAVFPLVRGNRLLGVLDVQSDQPGRFSDAEVRALLSLAAHVSIAIDNARLYEAERTARARGDALREAAHALNSTLSLDEVLEIILKQCAVVINYLTADIIIFEQSRPTRAVVAGEPGLVSLEQEKLDIIFDQSPILKGLLETRQSVIIPDVSAEPRWIQFPGEERIRSWMGVPMVARDSIIGILMLYGDAVGAFNREHLEFAQGLAVHAALAIENARLYHTLERQASHLEELVEARTAEVVHQQERLKAIVESAGEAIIFTGPDGLIEFTNPAWERLTGFDSQTVLGKPAADFMGNAGPDVYEGIARTMIAGDVWEGEVHARRPDGSEYDAAVTVAPVHDATGQLANAVGIIRDVSAQKEVERMRRKFVHNISHELRTPITNLKLFHALVGTGPAARREEYLDTMAGELARLERLIEDLLDISRLDQGVLSMRPTVLDINQIVREVERAHLLRAEESGQHLEIDLYDALPYIFGDRERVMQIIVNLLTNAINYTNQGDRIGVRTSLTSRDGEPNVALTVWDTGIGIAPEDLPFIFNRFFRAETAKVEGIPGTGLGLSIVKEIVEMHHGYVSVESEPGQGTTFTIYLPVAPMGEARGEAIAEPRNPL